MQFETLDNHHHKKNFDCGDIEINCYLQTMANQHHKKGVAKVHILTDGTSTIIGFYTLTSTSIELNLKGYPRYTPAIIIGRMGVDKQYQGQGISKLLLSHALQTIKKISLAVGVMITIIDAKDEGLAQYYQKFGFLPTQQPLRLILNINTISSV